MKLNYGSQLLSDCVFYRTYSQTKSDGYKESWRECVGRLESMHLAHFADKGAEVANTIRWAFDRVRAKVTLPSMRSLQFGGPAIEAENLRAYNCSAVAIDCVEALCELVYVLMCGTGVGYSVQCHHVAKLPRIQLGASGLTWLVPDSREGWADSVRILFENPAVNFDYSAIRPAGAPLKSGGTASGPAALILAHDRMRTLLLGACGRYLRPIEVHDICCILADMVVVGGVRRAALVSLFSWWDWEMMTAKQADWWVDAPWRARANNSAVILRDEIYAEHAFNAVMDACFESNAGEPGIFWTNDNEILSNPCVAGETEILTRKGYARIDSLVGTEVEVWNGFEWSKVTPQVTGHDQPMVKVTLSDGKSLRCTRAHNWVIVEGYGKRQIESRVRAEHLTVGMKLLKHEYPLVLEGLRVAPDLAYAQGFKSADGMDDYDFAWLYGEKIACGERMPGNFVGNISKTVGGLDRKKFVFSQPLEDKSFVPFDWDFTSRLEWLSGLFDGDGCELKEGGLQISSVDRQFLAGLQKMLTLCGVQAKILKGQDPGPRLMPDGHGGMKHFDCQESWRMCIGACQMQFLKSIGLRCTRMSFDKAPQRDASQFIKVVAIEESGTEETVYCFTEPKRNLGCFDGIVTGQCMEISLRSCGLCNLTEVNVAACRTPEQLAEAVTAAAIIGTLQAAYTKFGYVRPIWTVNAVAEALLGVSLTGLAMSVVKLTAGRLAALAQLVIDVNEIVARAIGINPCARGCTIKPSGSASAFLGTTSGIHPAHGKYLIRRVRIDKTQPVATYLANTYPHICEHDQMNPSNIIVAIPLKMQGAIVRDDETALELLSRMKVIADYWIEGGHVSGPNRHNVSLTVSYRPSEEEPIRQWMWANRESYGGISLLPFSDSSYVQMPFETITEEHYRDLMTRFPSVDLSKVQYGGMLDDRAQESACSGPLGCEWGAA